ncbi:DNA-binding response regulator [Sporanaerobium hydrogeniformans]|uniref:DNA-binding response regulator n=1 Tax=Sporanaerobium hydrogeniformans TaxID=3072179 RepID=A0AC61D6W2_9FIRM|nr:response regulator [Sporanaerobium hydrogeniformans]PHV69409.1 DNA-binding response regulator [Sporanaerobium hydrogeniformans]
MYRIMLADDEGIVINSLKFIIEKHFKDECVIEFAKTGRHVIELAERFRPDIAFMDIQMPGINGIEAIKEIKKVSPSTLFIVLSAYDKFEYAKEAIHLGVLEYLNKPVNQKVIVEIIEKAIHLINKQREQRNHDLMVKEKLEIVVPIIESGLIYAILFQEECPEDRLQYHELLGIKEEYGYVMVLEYGDVIEKGNLTNVVGASVKAQSFSYTLREIIKQYFDCVIGANMTNKTVIFVPFGKSQLEYSDRINIIEKAREMLVRLRQKIEVEFRIGIGKVKDLERLVESYREAVTAMKNSKGKVAHFNDLPSNSIYIEEYPVELEQTLLNTICRGRFAAARTETEHYFEQLIRNYPSCEAEIKLKILEIVLHSEQKVFSSQGMVYDFRNRKNYLSDMTEIDSYELLKKWFLQKISEICTEVNTKKKDQSTLCIEKAKAYIQKHYAKDISLDEVSREVDISPYYFSKLFKEVTGENFIEYVTDIRIENAKRLLDRGISIKEVGIEVGYSDPNYFSRIFKKIVGLTPTEFKEVKC